MSPALSSPATVRHAATPSSAMPAEVPFEGVLVPGLHGSDAHHWQTHWHHHQPWLRTLPVSDWRRPRLDVWQRALDQALSGITAPAVLIAHGFGCLASAVCATRHPQHVAGLLLVAPAWPRGPGLEPPGGPLPVPARIIASTTDPNMNLAESRELARRWGAAFRNGGDLGRINSVSGVGEWRRGLEDLRWLLAQRAL